MPIPKTERAEANRRALEHYANRISDIKEDKDLDPTISLGNMFLKQDLAENISKVRYVLSLYDEPSINSIPTENYDILCSALACYVKDLREAKEVVRTKLANAKLSFNNIEYEIKIAESSKTDLCQSVLREA
jgi:hypothetical protein